MKSPSRRAHDIARPSRIAEVLAGTIPVAKMELSHRSPWELLVATILSAQCTDQRVNQVTPALFERYPTPHDMAQAQAPELEALIKPTGFYKSKAKSLTGCAQAVAERFHGLVPSAMDALLSLPGVGRKTANVVRGTAFGQPAVVVDTHVKRVTNRLAFTCSEKPEVIESELQNIFPQHKWTEVSQRLLLHGRYVCLARAPRCKECRLYEECRWKGKRPR
jgi:endonuclease III